MEAQRGQLQDRSVINIIRQIYLEKRSGVLDLEQQGNRRRFHFLNGELYLPGSHPLAKRVDAFLDSEGKLKGTQKLQGSSAVGVDGERHDSQTGRKEALQQLEQLVQRIVEVLTEWREGRFTFEPSEEPPADLAGPLPTAYLVMEGAVRNVDEGTLLRRLGGEETLLVARIDSDVLTQLYGIDPGEMFLLSRAERPIRVGELLRQVSGGRQASLRMLCRLHAIGLIELVGDEDAASVAASEDHLYESMVERFLDRIGKRLRADPVKLDIEEHRSRLADLLGRLGSMSHYELLGVGFHADEQSVHDAFDEVARLVHPIHAARLGLAGREGAILLLFERATVAYMTLSDPERRADYNQRAGIDSNKPTNPQQRTEEQRQMAKANYERALRLTEAEDYYFALELAKLAARVDPRPDYLALVGRIQQRNPHWLQQAADTYRQAVKLDPDNPDLRVELGRVMEELGDTNRARIHFRSALQKDPDHLGAREALAQLGSSQPASVTAPATGRRQAAPQPSGGLMDRLKRFLSG